MSISARVGAYLRSFSGHFSLLKESDKVGFSYQKRKFTLLITACDSPPNEDCVNIETNDVTFEAWGPHQPDNTGGDENCAYMYTGRDEEPWRGKWNDFVCSEDKNGRNNVGAICEFLQ